MRPKTEPRKRLRKDWQPDLPTKRTPKHLGIIPEVSANDRERTSLEPSQEETCHFRTVVVGSGVVVWRGMVVFYMRC